MSRSLNWGAANAQAAALICAEQPRAICVFSLFYRCTASGAPALLAFLASTFEITASRFHDCHTPRSSVIYVGPQSVLMVANSSIGHCSTGDDPIFIAGICNWTDSQISDITAAGNTGALRLTGPSSTLEMRRSSILRC
eukprot:6185023-Pleurochrysis_carterae.AAC.1